MWYKEKINNHKIVFQFENGRTSLPECEMQQIGNQLSRGYESDTDTFVDFEEDHATEIPVVYSWKTVKAYKAELIAQIKNIIEEHGDFEAFEFSYIGVEAPVLKTNDPLIHTTEQYFKDSVKVFIYSEQYGDEEVGTYFLPYEKLSRTNLEDILEMAEQFKLDMEE